VFGEQRQRKRSKPRWPVYTAVAASLLVATVTAYLLILTSTQEPEFAQPQIPPQQVSSEPPALAQTEQKTLIEVPVSTPSAEAIGSDEEMITEEAVTSKAVATDVTVNTTDADPAADFTQLVFSDMSKSKVQAFTDLFEIWNRQYDPGRDGSACSYAVVNGLSCLHRQGNLRSLAILNRPAVLKLYDQQHNAAYAILTSLNDDEAILRKGDKNINIPVAVLNHYWLGEYTLLWQKPPYYQAAIQPGSQGPLVQWLDQQLVRIYGQDDVPTIHDTYDEELRSQIIKFQLSKGLTPDGVVGPHTFILLNSELDLSTPMLNTRKG